MSEGTKTRRSFFLTLGTGLLVFVLAFIAGVASKFTGSHGLTQSRVTWSDEIGTMVKDVSYGEKDSNKFDLYLPKDDSNESYGLAVYLHAGGFVAGDKADDRDMLAWLCQKGYVAAGVNYTLRNDKNDASVFSQSNEIKEAIPRIIQAAEDAGYHIDKMTVAGGSAGHALAMIYAYRDGKDAPVPVVFTFGAVGPSSFYREDWGIFGLDKSDDACAAMFGLMAGVEIAPAEVADRSYLEKVKPIAAAEWVDVNPVPTVVAYGARDKLQPFLASLRLKTALEENRVDHRYFELSHSGHALQNDDVLFKQWVKAIEEYLDKYMPVNKKGKRRPSESEAATL